MAFPSRFAQEPRRISGLGSNFREMAPEGPGMPVRSIPAGPPRAPVLARPIDRCGSGPGLIGIGS